jgi:hypothetical protein
MYWARIYLPTRPTSSTSLRQLDVMSNQLEESKRDREFQNQPLPWAHQIKLYVEKPRLFYSPSSENNIWVYDYLPRCKVEYKFKNIGASPSINTDILAKIVVKQPESEFLTLESNAVRIGVMEPGMVYPSNDVMPSGAHISSMLSAKKSDEKNNSAFLSAARERSTAELPRLSIKVLYKNVLGGCFVINNKFFVHIMNTEQDAIIAKWITSIMSFRINYKNEIDSLERLKSDDAKRRTLFDELKEKLNSIPGEDRIELVLRPIDQAFNVEIISIDKYNEFTNELTFARPLTPTGACGFNA